MCIFPVPLQYLLRDIWYHLSSTSIIGGVSSLLVLVYMCHTWGPSYSNCPTPFSLCPFPLPRRRRTARTGLINRQTTSRGTGLSFTTKITSSNDWAPVILAHWNMKGPHTRPWVQHDQGVCPTRGTTDMVHSKDLTLKPRALTTAYSPSSPSSSLDTLTAWGAIERTGV